MSIKVPRQLIDESVADVLTWLMGFVDAFEDHYVEPLSRWRQARYQELHQKDNEEQLHLSINPRIDDPF